MWKSPEAERWPYWIFTSLTRCRVQHLFQSNAFSCYSKDYWFKRGFLGSQGFWGLHGVSIYFTSLSERCLTVRLQKCFVGDKTSPDVSVSVEVSRRRLNFTFWADCSFKVDWFLIRLAVNAGGIHLQLRFYGVYFQKKKKKRHSHRAAEFWGPVCPLPVRVEPPHTAGFRLLFNYIE